MKSDRQLERVVKGFANHRRLQMLRLLGKRPELSLDEICALLNINLKTGSEHLRRLALAGLVLKRYEGRSVRHCLTDRAVHIMAMLANMP